METFWYVIVFSLIGGVVSLAGAVVLLSKQSIARKLAFYATPFAAGALLAAVFLDLFKEGFEEAVDATDATSMLYAALGGILLFFFAERFLRWFHHHHQHENTDPTVPLIVVGDTLHNALDGVAIAAAFLISIPTGIVTTIAVAAHEIPQEIGDFGLLLKKGVSRKRVLIINLLSALATVVAAVITYALGTAERLPTSVLLGLSAGFLLYIALSDIIPMLHEDTESKKLFDIQAILLVVGLLVVAVSINIAHGFIEEGHSHGAEGTQHEELHDHEKELHEAHDH